MYTTPKLPSLKSHFTGGRKVLINQSINQSYLIQNGGKTDSLKSSADIGAPKHYYINQDFNKTSMQKLRFDITSELILSWIKTGSYMYIHNIQHEFEQIKKSRKWNMVEILHATFVSQTD